MASKKELRALITLAGKIDPSLQSALLKASGESMKLSKNLQKSSNQLNKAGSIFKGTFFGNLAANATMRIGSEMSNIASESLELASDLREVQNVVDTTFGESAKSINTWSKQALNAYGLAELQAKQYSGTLGAMLKSSGITQSDMIKMSQNLTGLAGDFASFYNLDHDLSFQKIRAGISGEIEPLRQLGINMSVANMEAFALSKGITKSWNSLDEASKVTLRYAYLMEVSKDAQGDFTKTQGEYANQQRLFNTNLQEISATIASKALPYFNKFYQAVNKSVASGELDKYIALAASAFDTLGESIVWVGDNSEWLIPIMAGTAGGLAAFKIINTVTGLMNLWKASTIAQTYAQGGLNAVMIANPIGLMVIGISALIAAGVALWRNWDTIKEKAAELRDSVLKFLGPIGKLFGKGSTSLELQAKVTTPDIQDIPMDTFASGGFTSKPSIFGEDGPEAAIPIKYKNPRSLSLLNKTAQAIGARSSDSSVSITYAPTIYGGNSSELEPLLQRHKEELRMMVEDIIEGDRRVSFGY